MTSKSKIKPRLGNIPNTPPKNETCHHQENQNANASAYVAVFLCVLYRCTVMTISGNCTHMLFFFHLHPDPPRQQAVLNCDYPQEPVYTLLYFKWITNRVLLCSIGNTAQCYMAAWMGGEFGGNGYMCMYGRVPLLSTWNYHTVNQLYTNIKKSWKNIF